jgi:uncharacterized repeat protein (TIGR01451 family)
VTIYNPLGIKHDYATTDIDEGYQFIFAPETNGTYMLEAHADKVGYRISNTTLYVIVGQMSPLTMDVDIGNQITAKVSANGMPVACKVTMYTENGNTSIITTDGIAVFEAADEFYLVADRMLFEPATFTHIKDSIAVDIKTTPASAAPGGNVNLNITISNAGNYSFSQIEVIDYLPSNMSYLNDDRNGNISNKVISWTNLGPLPVGRSISIQLNASLDKNAQGYLDNQVNIMGIIPIDESTNFGSKAQAYATIRVLKPRIEVKKTFCNAK